MKKIYVLVEVDLQSYGFSAKNALVFTDFEKAKEKMREMYLEAFKKYYGEDDDRMQKIIMIMSFVILIAIFWAIII